jgi:hypothetical protein
MHIAPTTHEHGTSAKVYTYEGEYEVQPDKITWQVAVRQGDDDERTLTGAIALTSPSIATLAEQVVRDAIVKRIDALDDQQQQA